MPWVQHIVTQETGLLEGSDVLTYTIVQNWVVAGGQQRVNLVNERAEFFQFLLDVSGFYLSCCRRGVDGRQTVVVTAFGMGGIV